MTPGEDMSSALLGGGIGALYTSPVELMMIQQQVRNKPLIDTAKETVTRFGLTSGVYRGFVAAVARDSIYVGGMLGVTPIIQNVLMEEHEMGISSSGFVASMVGGIAAAVLTCPADVVNTCMKGDLAGTTYGTLTQTLKTLWADGGLKRYFSGVHWRCANITGTILIVNEVSVTSSHSSSTSFLINSRTLIGALTPPLERVERGEVGAPHQCPLGAVASYLIYADVRHSDDS